MKHQEFAAKLAQLGLPHEKLQVFGRIKLNVHVVVLSIEAAQKWAIALGRILPGANVYTGAHAWNAAQNNGTCMLPTKRTGYLVAVAA